jgi:HAD superfamily hydrolase (TIGR01459 family)
MNASPEIYPGIGLASQKFKGVLLDAYGVFWGGNAVGLLPGAQSMMEKMVSNGKIVGILSNTTALAFKEIDKLKITSGEVARYIFLNEKLPFETPHNKFWLFGGVHPKFTSHEPIFENTPYNQTEDISEADFIYISIPHINGEDQEHPEIFLKQIEDIKHRKLPMICPNPDQFAHEGMPPKLVVRQGTIASMYENMGGLVFYIGKPHNRAYAMAMNLFKEHKIDCPTHVLMVGDTPETDIRGARRFGMPSALITQTGIMEHRIKNKGLENALKELTLHDSPDYFIGKLVDDL